MSDTTPANGTSDQAHEEPVTVATTRAIDAYRRVITLQHQTDDARTEYERLLPQVPTADQVPFYEAITDIRTQAHQARHAADAEADKAAADDTEIAHEDHL